MTQRQPNQEPEHVIQLRAELKQALSLDLEELGLLEASSGEYESTFIGVHLQTAFQPIYDANQGDIYGYEALIRIWTPPVLQANRTNGFRCNCFRISGFLMSIQYPSHDGIRA